MTARRAVLVFALLAAAFPMPFAPAPSTARATCGTPDQDVSDLFSVSPPAPNLTLQGEAPFQVVITFVEKTVTSGPLTMGVTWGDGAVGQVNIVSCGNEVYSFAAQQLAHTFTTPGTFPVQWHLNSPFIGQIDSIAVIVTVTAAATQAPATPTAVPTATPQAATPTSAPATPPASAAVPTATPGEASVTASPAPSISPTSTPSPTPTSTPTPTTPVAAAVVTASPSPPNLDVPRLVFDVPDITDVSTDAGVATTNLVLAGVTVWVFFSSVLFNQTLQQNRDDVERWASRLRPKRTGGALHNRLTHLGRWPTVALVLAGTGFVYSFIDPGFGANRATLILVLSVILGVGLTGFFFAGLETWVRRRTPSVHAEVRPFPLALAIGAGCVVASRLLNLHPGVIYGFAASCVVVKTSADRPHDGKVMTVTVATTAVMSVLCWLLLQPVRSMPNGLVADVLESTMVIIFIGGMEALLIDLLPLDVMDGSKIFAWNRIVWALLALTVAFLVWHVLLNTNRSSFTSLREANSWSVLGAFAVYTLAGVGLWGFFAVRERRERKAAAA